MMQHQLVFLFFILGAFLPLLLLHSLLELRNPKDDRPRRIVETVTEDPKIV